MLDIRFFVDSSFPLVLWICHCTASGLHFFWWKVSCLSYWRSFVYDKSFFSCCFQGFLFYLAFNIFTMVCLGVDFVCMWIYLEFIKRPEYVDYCVFKIKFGTFTTIMSLNFFLNNHNCLLAILSSKNDIIWKKWPVQFTTQIISQLVTLETTIIPWYTMCTSLLSQQMFKKYWDLVKLIILILK